MRLKGALVGVTVLMLAACLPLPASAGAQAGRLIGFLAHQPKHSHGHAKQSLHLVLTSASGHKRHIAVGHSGRFSARLPAGRYGICDTTATKGCPHSACPVTLIGTRFGPTGQSPPVSTIVILPKLKTHIQVTCAA